MLVYQQRNNEKNRSTFNWYRILEVNDIESLKFPLFFIMYNKQCNVMLFLCSRIWVSFIQGVLYIFHPFILNKAVLFMELFIPTRTSFSLFFSAFRPFWYTTIRFFTAPFFFSEANSFPRKWFEIRVKRLAGKFLWSRYTEYFIIRENSFSIFIRQSRYIPNTSVGLIFFVRARMRD